MPNEVPTEPGWYYWTATNELAVGTYGSKARPMWCDNKSGIATLARIGILGPRIPSPERLEALERLAKADPMDYDPDGIPICHHCNARHSPPYGRTLHHSPDCPWTAAQEAKPCN